MCSVCQLTSDADQDRILIVGVKTRPTEAETNADDSLVEAKMTANWVCMVGNEEILGSRGIICRHR